MQKSPRPIVAFQVAYLLIFIHHRYAHIYTAEMNNFCVVWLLLHPNQVIIQVNTWLDAIIYHDRDLHQYVDAAV